MSGEHEGKVGWAGYFRKPVCSCGWAGGRWRMLPHAERELACHLAAPGVRAS